MVQPSLSFGHKLSDFNIAFDDTMTASVDKIKNFCAKNNIAVVIGAGVLTLPVAAVALIVGGLFRGATGVARKLAISDKKILAEMNNQGMPKALAFQLKLDQWDPVLGDNQRLRMATKCIANRQDHYSTDHPCTAYAVQMTAHGYQRVCLGYFSTTYYKYAKSYAKLAADLMSGKGLGYRALHECGSHNEGTIVKLTSAGGKLVTSWEKSEEGRQAFSLGKAGPAKPASTVPVVNPSAKIRLTRIAHAVSTLENRVASKEGTKAAQQKLAEAQEQQRIAGERVKQKIKQDLGKIQPTGQMSLSIPWLRYEAQRISGKPVSEDEVRKLVANRKDVYDRAHRYAAYAIVIDDDGVYKRVCLGYFGQEHAKNAEAYVELAAGQLGNKEGVFKGIPLSKYEYEPEKWVKWVKGYESNTGSVTCLDVPYREMPAVWDKLEQSEEESLKAKTSYTFGPVKEKKPANQIEHIMPEVSET